MRGIPLLFALYLLASPPIVLANRYLTFEFNALSQNAWRYLAGTVFMAILYHQRWRYAAFMKDLGGVLAVLAAGIAQAGAMYLSTRGTALTSAVTSNIIGILGLPMTILFARLFFTDERRGSATGVWVHIGVLFAATIGYACAHPVGTGGAESTEGIVCLVASVVLFTGALLVVKNAVRHFDTMGLTVIMALTTTVCCFVAALAQGALQTPRLDEPFVAGVLFGSGAFGLWVGCAFTNYLIARAGVVPYQIVCTLAPPLVGVAGWLVLREAMSLGQVACGVIMVVAVLSLIRYRNGSPEGKAPLSTVPSTDTVPDPA